METRLDKIVADGAIPHWWSPQMTSNTSPAPLVASSSTYFTSGSLLAFKAFNNQNSPSSITDMWCGTDADPWLKIDFGVTKVLDGVRLSPRAQNTVSRQFPKSITVQVSQDGTTWQTVAQKRDIPEQVNGAVWHVLDFPTVSARYVQFIELKVGGCWDSYGYVAIGEIEFHVLA